MRRNYNGRRLAVRAYDSAALRATRSNDGLQQHVASILWLPVRALLAPAPPRPPAQRRVGPVLLASYPPALLRALGVLRPNDHRSTLTAHATTFAGSLHGCCFGPSLCTRVNPSILKLCEQ